MDMDMNIDGGDNTVLAYRTVGYQPASQPNKHLSSMTSSEHAAQEDGWLLSLPDELCLWILYFLDVNDILSASRTNRRLRALSLDPLLHKWRLQFSQSRVGYLLPRRPLLHTIQPPLSTIYLTRTHLAARRLHWSLVCVRLNRSLLRRPKLATLVAKHILPKECCRRDRGSGEFIWSVAAGSLSEAKRRIEIEKIKEGLRVWLERKAHQIRAKRKEGGVGILVWKLSHRNKSASVQQGHSSDAGVQKPKQEKVSSLRRFFESLGNGSIS